MNKNIVLDLHGIVFSFDEDLEKSEKLLNKEIKNRGLKNLFDVKLYLEAEFEIVKDITQNKFKGFPILEIDNSIENIKKLLKENCKFIIISTSQIETSKLILEYLGLSKQQIESMDIYNNAVLGPKDDFLTWAEILSEYNKIDEIYEYDNMNLKAALKASRKLKFNTKGFTSLN